jgi:hypothetical protein
MAFPQFNKNMNKLKSLALEIWATLRTLVHLKYDGLRLKLAIYMADSKQRAHNKRYYVLPDWNDNLQVFCKDELRILQTPLRRRYFVKGHFNDRHKWVKGGYKVEKIYQMSPKADHLTVMKECFYYTPTHLNNTGIIPEKEREAKKAEWLKYMEAVRYKKALKNANTKP